MPHQLLFIQGGGADGAHDEWDNKLVDDLGRELGPDFEIRYPLMPHEADPRYSRWKAALMHEFGKLDDGAILVGHSIGGTMLINALVEEPPDLELGGIVLPWKRGRNGAVRACRPVRDSYSASCRTPTYRP